MPRDGRQPVPKQTWPRLSEQDLRQFFQQMLVKEGRAFNPGDQPSLVPLFRKALALSQGQSAPRASLPAVDPSTMPG